MPWGRPFRSALPSRIFDGGYVVPQAQPPVHDVCLGIPMCACGHPHYLQSQRARWRLLRCTRSAARLDTLVRPRAMDVLSSCFACVYVVWWPHGGRGEEGEGLGEPYEVRVAVTLLCLEYELNLIEMRVLGFRSPLMRRRGIPPICVYRRP